MFKMTTIWLLLIIIILKCDQNQISGANILTISSVSSHSHFLWHRILVKELVNHGHNITFLTPDSDKNVANYTIIQLEDVYKKFENSGKLDLENLPGTSSFSTILFDWMYIQCEFQLSTNGFKKIMEYPKNFFDLIIIDVSCGPECYFPLIKKLGSPPLVGTSPFGLVPWLNSYTGDWLYPATVPYYELPYSDEMSFPERFHNFLVTIFIVFYRNYVNIGATLQNMKKFYGPDADYSLDLEKKINVILTNIDPILGLPRPHVPNIIPIGGLHIKLQENLPTEIKQFLDNASEGVILFSLGSNIQSNKLSPSKQKMILEAFKQLPYKVLWKWESEKMDNKPNNVMIRKWLPQCDVLNHPNVKLFFTHGGELSIQEAIYYSKPIVGMPFFLDQKYNLKRMNHKGLGVTLDFTTLTKEKIVEAINEVMTNPKYRKNIEKFSKLFRDQPETPMERGIFWIEYVLRNKNVPELQCSSMHMPFYQTYCLDIIGTLLILIYIMIKILKMVLKLIYSLIFKRKQLKQKMN